MDKTRNLDLIKRIKALGDTGLVYAENEYDRERYEEIREIGLALLGAVSENSLKTLKNFFMPVTDYPTAKVDVRGFVLNDANEILMAKESIDGKWTIPGGWADIGYSPSEVVVKEIEEETGLQSKVERMLAVYDKKCHPHPPEPYYIYKLIFLCTVTGGTLKPGFDMRGASFFSIDDLPELSEDRIVESQLQQLFKMVIEDDLQVHFD